ncbi:hypothetical protein F511_28828 [Dorcoceras hygrometricum]|uniref:CCHC-type domain-containing protein n=1 Tax=Dorcoceras hygrometricum TaxID=472368 RepID=A0A2Z7AE17_9LAMI|nr:hypothetical protein F511_28828 [Dorcoceras hygrometricum]
MATPSWNWSEPVPRRQQAASRERDPDSSLHQQYRGGVVAEGWLEHMEGLFDRIKYDEDRRLSLATFQLREHAYRWWKGASRAIREMDIVISWESVTPKPMGINGLGDYSHTIVLSLPDDRVLYALEICFVRSGFVVKAGRWWNPVAAHVALACFVSSGKRQHLVKWVRRRFGYQLQGICSHVCRLVVSLRADVNASQSSCSARGLATGFDDVGDSSSSSGSRAEFCGFCGGKHPSTQCVGVQGSCNLCGQYGHFARVCPSAGSQQAAAPPQDRGGQSRGRSPQFQQPRLGETPFRPFQ